ncbi:MAG: cobaltochelatase subunit CobN, partial [Pseudorhodobacter sp.]
MHVVFRESHGLEETDTPFDVGQSPADLVVLSFSDSDLGAFAAGWQRGRENLPPTRLANLVALRHPLSVDTYVENTLADAKGILIRLIGGESYWAYGLAQVQDLCRRRGIALAILPADGRPDARLDELSTLPVSTLRRLSALCEAGGAVAAQAALAQLALAAGLYARPVLGDKSVPECGWYDPEKGVTCAPPDEGPAVAVTFYRSYLTSADTSPVDALINRLRARGFNAIGLFANSLKAPVSAEWVRQALTTLAPAAVINATAFSAKGADGTSPLDAPGCPVFQVGLSTARRKDWENADRGLSPADLAMHVVLPEVDGRIFAGAVSFKAPTPRDPDLQFSRFTHRANETLVEAVVDKVSAWHQLAQTPAKARRLALVLSTYPGKTYQLAHAVGLDALASSEAILTSLQNAGYSTNPGENLGQDLTQQTLSWPLASYAQALKTLPKALQDDLANAWGTPETDPSADNGSFHFKALRRDHALIALQPERGDVQSRDDDYHDLTRTPRHAYVAFYLWLRAQGLHAL